MKNRIVIIILFLSIITSCKENNSSETDYNPNVLSSKDYIRAEDAVFEVVNAFFKGVNDTLVIDNGYGYIDNCDVTFLPAHNALLFGYGVENRYCQDGKFRRGNFVANFTGSIFEEGTTVLIATDSLFVDDFLIEISMTIEHVGLNSGNKDEYFLALDSSLVMLPDTTKLNGVRMQADLTLVWEEGATTPEIHEDDLYLVTGNASGISSDGYGFSIDIQEPLYNWLDCYWIAQGNSQITVPSGEITSGNIDYVLEDGCSNTFYFYFDNSTFFDQIK